MLYLQSKCSGLYVCSAILCLDLKLVTYLFLNITKCTPTSSLRFKSNVQLIVENSNNASIEKKYLTNGFVCSDCSRTNFISSKKNRAYRCSKQATMIELRNFCRYSYQYKGKESHCQCLPSVKPIQTIKDWIKSFVKNGKSHVNSNRVNNINKSSVKFIYFLTGFILLIVLVGGIISMTFYSIKSKSSQRHIFK